MKSRNQFFKFVSFLTLVCFTFSDFGFSSTPEIFNRTNPSPEQLQPQTTTRHPEAEGRRISEILRAACPERRCAQDDDSRRAQDDGFVLSSLDFLQGQTVVRKSTIPTKPALTVPAPDFVSAGVVKDGGFQVRWKGEPGRPYLVQGTRDLIHWETLAHVTADPKGFLEFTDTAVKNSPSRFYRALSPPASPLPQPEVYVVQRIVDGDTLVLSNGEKVRLIGVDTPESVDPRRPVEYFAKEAADFTRRMVEGKEVRLEYDWQRRDRFGRLLAYVFRVLDNFFLNAEIIKQGFGFAYTRFPFKYLEEFRRYEREAREAGRGLWKGR